MNRTSLGNGNVRLSTGRAHIQQMVLVASQASAGRLSRRARAFRRARCLESAADERIV
jgi:hypothetical protein